MISKFSIIVKHRCLKQKYIIKIKLLTLEVLKNKGLDIIYKQYLQIFKFKFYIHFLYLKKTQNEITMAVIIIHMTQNGSVLSTSWKGTFQFMPHIPLISCNGKNMVAIDANIFIRLSSCREQFVKFASTLAWNVFLASSSFLSIIIVVLCKLLILLFK